MIILKLGGSLITDKTKKFSVRKDVLDRVAREIKAGAKEELIIIHGGGSYGHPIADEYKLNEGFKDEDQLKGVALTRKAMGELNQCVIEALIGKDVPAIAIQPSSNIICKGGRIHKINLDVIKRFIALKIVPVLYGDVVADINQGFCILSGDQMISRLAEAFNPKKVVLAMDVDGIFNKDPKKFKDAKLITEINPANFQGIFQGLEPLSNDVTGGIKGKLLELVNLANKGFDSQIINALKPGRLKKALLGDEIIGTKVKRGKYDRL
jgi:isopentenyl phosphate kinase